MITLVRAQKHRHSNELVPALDSDAIFITSLASGLISTSESDQRRFPRCRTGRRRMAGEKGYGRITIQIQDRIIRTRLAAPMITVGTEQQPRRKASLSDRLRLWPTARKSPLSRLAKVSGASLESKPDSGYGDPTAGIRAHAGGRTRLAAPEISLGESRDRSSTENSQFASSCFSRKSGQPRNIEANCADARSASTSKLIPATTLPTFRILILPGSSS